jgi:hypothetical protein
MTAIIRWTFLVLGLIGTIVVVYLHAFAPHLLGVRRDRFENLAIGVGCLVLLVGTWSSHPIGWYAGLAFCIYNVVDIAWRWRRLLPEPTATSVKVGTSIWFTFNVFLIVVLLSGVGRRTFNLETF